MLRLILAMLIVLACSTTRAHAEPDFRKCYDDVWLKYNNTNVADCVEQEKKWSAIFDNSRQYHDRYKDDEPLSLPPPRQPDVVIEIRKRSDYQLFPVELYPGRK